MSRYFSVPERLVGLGCAVAAAALVWPAVTDLSGLGLPCPLRAVTGVPCPVCGSTTAAVALVRGDLATAAAASPAFIGFAAVVLAVAPLLALRVAGLLAPPVPWPDARRRRMGWVLGLLAVASWIYQLHRLGVRRA